MNTGRHVPRLRPVARRGVARFTLVELLVVVSIITILAAILLPSLTKARQRARAAACASNFKQFGLALSMYAGDSDDWLPTGKYNIPVGISAGRMRALIQYGVTRSIFICPANPTAVPGKRYTPNYFPGTAADVINIPYYYYGGDGYFLSNEDHFTASDNDPWYGWRISGTTWHRAKEGIRPTPRFMINDRSASICPVSWDTSFRAGQAAPHGDFPSQESNHAGPDGFSAFGLNMLYVDGHVSWHPLTAGYGPEQFMYGYYR